MVRFFAEMAQMHREILAHERERERRARMDSLHARADRIADILEPLHKWADAQPTEGRVIQRKPIRRAVAQIITAGRYLTDALNAIRAVHALIGDDGFSAACSATDMALDCAAFRAGQAVAAADLAGVREASGRRGDDASARKRRTDSLAADLAARDGSASDLAREVVGSGTVAVTKGHLERRIGFFRRKPAST
jgi:hypothetical protein